MKKGDKIIVLIIAVAVIFGGVLILLNLGEGAVVTVKQNNKTVYEGSINTDKEIVLSGNTVVIEAGQVYVSYAICKNQVCVKHSKISKAGESIICLPNKVIVEIS